MKKWFFLPLLLLLVFGCVPSEYQKAEDLVAHKNYIAALKYYEISLEHTSNPTKQGEIQQKIWEIKEKIVDDVLERARNISYSAPHPTIQVVDNVLRVLNENLSYDDKNKRISRKIDEVVKEKNELRHRLRELERKSDRFVNKGDYSSALRALDEALKIDTTNATLAQKRTKLENEARSLKKYYYNQISSAIRNGNGKKAEQIYEKLVLFPCKDIDLKSLKSKIDRCYSEQLISEVTQLEDQNRWFQAYTLLKNSNFRGIEQEIEKIKRLGSAYYYNNARTLCDLGEIHRAYASIVKAKKLNPKDLAISTLYETCDDLIQKEIQIYIAVAGFGSPKDEPDIGTLFSDTLLTKLSTIVSFGINLIEREKIDILLKEKKMEHKSNENILGVDLILSGNVSLLKIDRNVSATLATAKVKVGEEEQTNPKFLLYLKLYGSDTSNWPEIPPETIKEDKYEIVKYKKGKVSMEAFVNVSVRIFDTKRAKIVYAKEFQDSLTKTDTFQESVKEAGIKEDPLELPSKTKIESELLNKVINRIIAAIPPYFVHRESKFLERAKDHIKRQEYKKALKFLDQGYLFCQHAKVNNETSREIFNLLVQLSERAG